jgi:4'-phosphopantetheinyl transferase
MTARATVPSRTDFEPLTRGAIGVWLVEWPSVRLEACEALLSADERARAARFAFGRDRHCFAATRGVLRTLVGWQLEADASRLEFAYDGYGKPSLAGVWRGLLDFNVSHSGTAAVVALSRAGAVGVDVEQVRRIEDRDAIAARTFAPGEAAAIADLEEPARDRAFFTCWTRKEAFVKATGEGLSYPLDRFEVSVDPRGERRLLDVGGDAMETRRWTLLDLPVADGYVGALAVRAMPLAVGVRRWGDPHGRVAAVDLEGCLT